MEKEKKSYQEFLEELKHKHEEEGMCIIEEAKKLNQLQANCTSLEEAAFIVSEMMRLKLKLDTQGMYLNLYLNVCLN